MMNEDLINLKINPVGVSWQQNQDLDPETQCEPHQNQRFMIKVLMETAEIRNWKSLNKHLNTSSVRDQFSETVSEMNLLTLFSGFIHCYVSFIQNHIIQTLLIKTNFNLNMCQLKIESLQPEP